MAACACTYWISRRVILRQAQEHIATITQAAAAEVKAYVDQRHSELITVSQSPLFKDHYTNVEYGLAHEAGIYHREIERMLTDLSRRSKAYNRLAYLDPLGREICAVDDKGMARQETNPLAPDFLGRLRSLPSGRRALSPLLDAGGRCADVVCFGTPLRDGAGRLRGALVFDVSLAPVNGFLGSLRLGTSGRIYLEDHSQGMQRAPSRTHLLSEASVPGTSWSVVTSMNRADLLASLAWVKNLTLLLALLTSAMLALVTVRQVRFLLKPLETLTKAVMRYAGGDLSARVKVEGPQEVAALSDTFNIMAENLKAHTDDLLQKVREVSALHRLNESVLSQIGRRAIAKSCLEAAVRGLAFDRGILYWFDENAKEFIAECTYESAQDSAPAQADSHTRRIPMDDAPTMAQAVRERRVMEVERAAVQDPALPPGLSFGTFFAAPVIVRERVIAVLCVGRDDQGWRADARALRSISLFAAAVGLALSNAQLLDELVVSEGRHRSAVENSPFAVVGLNQNMRITLWNRRAEALFGYQPTEAYGRTLDMILNEQDYQSLKRRVETEGAVRQAEVPGKARDDRRLELSLSWTGQSAGPHSPREWFVVMQDETENKRIRSQLVQAEKMMTVGSLIAGVAHELNNPLSAITGFAEMLRDLPVSGEEKKDLHYLYTSAMRCRDIVHGLLRFVRQGKPIRRRISLNYVAQATLDLFEYRLRNTEGIELDVSLDPQAPMVAGEFQKLQQVFVNLITNACDALRGRSESRIIRIKTRAVAGGCELEVADTGPGIPPEVREHLFEPFFTTKPVGQGTGLGLSICAQIVSDLAGKMRYEQENSQGGARFIASFPPCPAGLPEAEDECKLPPSVPGRKVLVVDDEPQLVHLMQRLLSEDGLIASSCAVEDSFKKIREGDFDLVIADIDMGTVKGTWLLGAAKGLPSEPAFILVTGDVLNTALAQELTNLKVPVINKPFLRAEFLREVRRSLTHHCAIHRPKS
jgi:two-component system NtrC family sensor kinase